MSDINKEVTNNPFYNKGTAFSNEERKELGLIGLLPNQVKTIEQQMHQTINNLQSLKDDYQKHLYLMNIYTVNRTLFYYTVEQHIEELLPIIYTPTIAEAVQNYSKQFNQHNESVYLSVNEPHFIKEALLNGSKHLKEVKLMVITDGEGVLGIGDWGVNGAAIAVGKLAVYTVAAGINPKNVMPIVIDAGTNNQHLLDDPSYLGNRHKRLSDEGYFKFIDTFVMVAKDLFPKAIFHWEDFGIRHAETILEKYKNDLKTFNDDIQGTGIMIVAALESVVNITQQTLDNHKILIFGAGTAGIGIADQIAAELIHSGLSEEEAKEKINLFDRYGLVKKGQENLTSGQKRYATSLNNESKVPESLEEVIEYLKPSVLIGTSGQSGAFTEQVVKKMHQNSERPAIFPISNPSKLAEAKAIDLINWTEGKALVVTGSPSKSVQYNGIEYKIGQANNALLYPGLGLGLIVAQPEYVSDNILLSAAKGVTELQDLEKVGASLLPEIKKLRDASKLVAKAVVEAAIEEGINEKDINNIDDAIDEVIWKIEYDNIK